MQPVIVFNLNSETTLFDQVRSVINSEHGKVFIHRFPDGETSVRIDTNVRNKTCLVLAELKEPDKWIMPLYYLCNGLKDYAANRIVLVLPYLPYMRQDAAFKPGEVITSKHFAQLINQICTDLITVDPHLHRYSNLNEIYSVPTQVVTSADAIGRWINTHIQDSFLIGPDSESRQWVAGVAAKINRPFAVLEKIRQGDRKVEIRFDDFNACRNSTPVIVDDIISTAATMINATHQLKSMGFKNIITIGVHALFAQNAYEDLAEAGVSQINTCNTLFHASNKIDISPDICFGLKSMLNL